ncbi:MAG: hypothetical protein GQ572_09460 [Gammaproteobacteria bacterium]|nr:hypothetical protein [Gammaproteobacteria bacterium]
MITQQTNYSDIAAAHKQNTTADNKNISSVLSQIQDDGPAYADLQRRGNLIDLRSDKSNQTPAMQQSAGVNNEKKQPDLSAAIIPNRMQNHGRDVRDRDTVATGINKNKTTWIQLSLILFVALVITFFLFRLDARTDQLEVSLNSLDDDVLDSIDSYDNEISPEFRSIKKALKAVKQELELIKGNTVPGMKFDKPAVSKSFVNEQFQQTSMNDNIDIMEDEILALKNELKIAKDKLKVISANKAGYKNLTIDEKTSAVTAISTTGWVANLASFTNKNKADKSLEPLYAAGLLPLIQEANVNGRRIYRLIIDGFASQADAKLFVRRADDEFGLPGGWIRKS